MMDSNVGFRTRARVINQLGEQLIKNEAIALLELIKNSYDADASKCSVTMVRPEYPESAKIMIEDDGEGMDYETLSTVWLELGTSFKEDLSKDESRRRSAKFHRLRLGEKGIGRLGVHRLGRDIEIATRKRNCRECVLRINWDLIASSRYVEDIPISISERSPEAFPHGATGTRIVISRLKVPWTRKLARDCARAVLSLNSPFESDDSFRVTFSIPGSTWLHSLLSFAEIDQYKLFSFDITVSGSNITSFSYEFLPWSTMQKLAPRRITQSDPEISGLLRMQYKDGTNYQDINLDKYEIGPLRIAGVIFDRDTRTLDLGVQDKAGLKRYLDANGGVRVFRDNMRVLDYGEPGNDWLDLGGRRVNMPTKRISNNIIMGAVYIQRESSGDLLEKANREGFVENEAYWELWHAIRFAIDRVESLRKTDKDLLRKYYGPQVTSEPVTTSIAELKDLVGRNVRSDPTKRDIFRYLERIEAEYEAITGSLIRSAGAGLNLIVVIHQVEKIIKEIHAMLKKRVDLEVLEERVRTLSSLIEGYSILVRHSDKKARDLKKVVEQCIFNMHFRLEAHGISLDAVYRERLGDQMAICSESHVLNALMNVIDNSIWWLGYSRTCNPSVYLDISDELPGYLSIIIADNGPGFSKPTDEIIRPFVSDKPGGMGIGLHLTHQVMESMNGRLLFPATADFDIPDGYARGAKIALAFRQGDN